MFQERTRLVVYMETADLERITATAREAGKTVVEWAREVLLELGEPKTVRETRPVGVVRRRPSALERLPIVGDSGGAGQSDASASAGEWEGAAEPSRKKFCKHGIEKGWRCWQCGGMAVIE